MLATNRILAFLETNFTDSLDALGISLNSIQLLKSTHGQLVPGPQLSLPQRLAYLSVIRSCTSSLTDEPPRKRSRVTSAMRQADFGRLDCPVVSLIFEFARRQRVSREINITAPGYSEDETDEDEDSECMYSYDSEFDSE